MKMHINRFM